jgi:hypothetical protein
MVGRALVSRVALRRIAVRRRKDRRVDVIVGDVDGRQHGRLESVFEVVDLPLDGAGDAGEDGEAPVVVTPMGFNVGVISCVVLQEVMVTNLECLRPGCIRVRSVDGASDRK